MTKKLLVFTMSEAQSKYETERVIDEAKKMGIEAERALYRELSFDLVDGEPKVFWKGQRLGKENLWGMWFRVAGTRTGKYVWGKNMLIKILENEVFCVNHGGYLRWQRMGSYCNMRCLLERGFQWYRLRFFIHWNKCCRVIWESYLGGR